MVKPSTSMWLDAAWLFKSRVQLRPSAIDMTTFLPLLWSPSLVCSPPEPSAASSPRLGGSAAPVNTHRHTNAVWPLTLFFSRYHIMVLFMAQRDTGKRTMDTCQQWRPEHSPAQKRASAALQWVQRAAIVQTGTVRQTKHTE